MEKLSSVVKLIILASNLFRDNMTSQHHYNRMTKVIRHIEDHLDNDIQMSKLLSLACYSQFHFHRVFCSFVGESIYAYKKRLLLERAIKLLRYSNHSMTDIALKSGYDNSSSFNKAFKNYFSCTRRLPPKSRHLS